MRKTLVSCRDCGKEISKKAKTCPNCGASTEKMTLAKWVFVLLGSFIIYFAVIAPENIKQNEAGTTPNEQLELISSDCFEKDGYFYVIGEVKNISEHPIHSLTVVGTLRTKEEKLIKSISAIVEYNPIMPGQSSPFEALDRANPLVYKCGISFKTIMGGTIDYKHNLSSEISH